jgi:hypothetical protein
MASANRNPVASDLVARLPVSPDAYPQKIALLRGLLLVFGIDAGAYRASSFLDDRILTPSTQGTWVSLARAADAAARITQPLPLHFIFHTGHVGSTLVSRLLDETGVVLPLREPLPLRSLAEAHDVLPMPESLLSGPQFAETLGTMLQLWSRGYDWTRAVIVKATSSAGRLAIPRLESRPATRAICLNLRAEPYLATLLAAPIRPKGPLRAPRAACAPTGALRNMPDALHGCPETGGARLAAWKRRRSGCNGPFEQIIAVDFDAFPPRCGTHGAIRATGPAAGRAPPAGVSQARPCSALRRRPTRLIRPRTAPGPCATRVATTRRKSAAAWHGSSAWHGPNPRSRPCRPAPADAEVHDRQPAACGRTGAAGPAFRG